MVSSVILAKILGPYCTIVALGILLNLKTYRKMIEDFLKNSAIVYIAGVLSLIFSLLIIQFHNVWILDWPVIITLLGWLGLFKGIRFIAFPNSLPKAIAFYQKNPSWLTIRVGLILFLGIVLTVFGYCAYA